MSDPESTTDPAEEVLIQFVRELGQAADPEALVGKYQADHPALAGRFEEMAATSRRLNRCLAEAHETPPQQLGGFRLVRLIAQGGMGEVYEALEERLQRRVAVKIIRRQQTAPEYRARFDWEQQVLARLHQTHIVPIFASGEAGSLQYFVMPYIEGATLHHALEVARRQATPWPDGQTPNLSTLADLYRAGGGPAAPATVPHTGPEPAAPAPAASRPRLSSAFFRSVARAMANVADALQHAHDKGIIHRDVKPSNIMVARAGARDETCWIIDFGLAGYLGDAQADGHAEPAGRGPRARTVGRARGTPQYMAPEQWAAPDKVDARTDVWGLGVTLSELLTLESVFKGSSYEAIRAQVLSPQPVAFPRDIRGVPADLAAICARALQKKPEHRYQSAREFADDLHRWLRGEPVRAGRMHRLRQVAWLARQNKGLAAAIALVVLLVGGAWWGAAREAEVATAQAEAESARANEEKARADAASDALLLQQAQRLRLANRETGWSGKAWQKVEAAPLRLGAERRNHAAAALAGLDAREIKHLRRGASGVAWNPNGDRLLIGGGKDGTARLWESGPDEEAPLRRVGQGPVAFRADGTPVQLAADPRDRWSVGLWDVSKGRLIRSFRVPPGEKPEPPSAVSPVVLAMTDSGAFVAAATSEVDNKGNAVKGHLAAWDAAGKLLVKAFAKATALALSPDGDWLAAGDEEGRIRLWSLPQGKELEPLSAGRTEIQCLAFGRNPHRPEAGRGGRGPSWLLASGAAGGAVTVWDLGTRQVKSLCQGSEWAVYAVAFSPDGMTLASAGHGGGKLWDVATGRLLLTAMAPDHVADVAFSPDGQRLAIGSSRDLTPVSSGGVAVHQLDLGRGMQTLRGLAGIVAHVHFSPDGRYLAALSHDWQAAVWDIRKNRLLHVLDVPQGLFADNAHLCFNAGGTRLAFVTGQKAKMWEVASARELGSWDLPFGLADRVAFRAEEELVLFRAETAAGLPPFGNVPWRQHPRVCRIRHLTPPKQIKEVAAIEEFTAYIFDVAITPGGSHIVIEGLGGPDGGRHGVRIYDTTTGKEVKRLPFSRTKRYGYLRLDATGKLLAYRPTDAEQVPLVGVPSGEVKHLLPHPAASLAPQASYWTSTDPQPGLTLIRRRDGQRLVTLGIDDGPAGDMPFSPDGKHLAWGHTDGRVTVCDIPAVQRRLAAIGLGW